MLGTLIAYCGPAAVPDDFWTRWNADPLLLLILAALAFVVARGYSSNARAGWAAIALMFVIFVSPLCALASALFSARVFHHVLLIAAVAPLLAVAFPMRRIGSPPLALLVGMHAVILWLWHAPEPYAWGLASVPAYWLMQGSLLGSAWLMWRAILAPRFAAWSGALMALVATIAQMGLLGALIVFAPRPLYWVHLGEHGTVGTQPARGPAARRTADVGACDAALSDSRPQARVVQPAAVRAGAVTTFLKFVHLAAIAIWSGGLIVLPFLFWQRRGLPPGRDLDRLHRLSRFVYVAMTSPAAFIAIGSGTALIFLQQTYEEWFSLKMVAVGAMVMLHVVAGLFLERIFDPDGRFSAFSYSALTGAYLVVITAILWIVLAKPDIDANEFAPHLFDPGALRQYFGFSASPKP